MSKFGNKLDELINRSGGNKYRLCKDTGIDRVTLYRAINGERVPGKDFIDKICAALQLSLAEEKELRELYDIAKIGEDVFKRRLLVKDLANHVNSLRLEQRPKNTQKTVIVEGIDDTLRVVSGSYNVNMLVRDLLDDLAYNTNPKRLWIKAPFDYSFLFDHLRQLYFELNGAIEIEHAAAFARNTKSQSNPNANLETLAGILPFVFYEGAGYRPAYYYPDSMNCDSIFLPYCLFTEKRLLMLAADYKTAMLINNQDALNACRAEYSALRTTPLFMHIANVTDIAGVYLDLSKHKRVSDVIGIEWQPCLIGFFSEDMAETYIKKHLAERDMIVQVLIKMISCLKDIRIHSFFTIEGLQDFVCNGYSITTPPQYALPFCIDDRLRLLVSLRNAIDADISNSRVINPSAILVSPETTIQIFTGSAMLFSIYNESGARMCVIEESGIYEAFNDFFQSLHHTEWVYSKQETLAILDKYICELQKTNAAFSRKC